MNSKSWLVFGAVFVISACVIAAVYWAGFAPRKPIAREGLGASQSQSNDVENVEDKTSNWIEIGGIRRPPSDVQLGTTKTDNAFPVVKAPQGFSPALAPDTNPQVAGVYASLKTRDKPSHFSSFAPAEPFDLESFKKNPDEYLNTVEPSRVFSPAQPGEGVVAIQAKGSRFHRVKQGETVSLAVNAERGVPISFSSFSLGFFENKLSSITVGTGDDGVAQANFTAGGGTIDLVKILAAGPMTTGQVAFDVHVSVPLE